MKRTYAFRATLLAVFAAMLVQAAGCKPAGAEAYYQWLRGCLDGLERDLPQTVRSAEAAAQLYVNDDHQIGTYGDRGFAGESGGRSGGMMRMLSPGQIADPKRKSIVLFALREDRWDEAMDKARQYLAAGGKMVIAFARPDLIDRAAAEGVTFDAVVDNHAAPHGGLFAAGDGKWLVPTSPPANLAAMWVWTGEFVAACTRMGKMPPMYLGYAVEGGKERAEKITKTIGYAKFHTEEATPVDAGRIGREFLKELRDDLAALHRNEMGDIREVARLAVETKARGGGLYVNLATHASQSGQIGYPHDPGYFTQSNTGWFDQRKDVTFKPGDLVFCVGFDQPFHGWKHGDWDEQARAAGAELAWSFTSYRRKDAVELPPGEIFIDQHWRFGDAVATVPGYDIKILPTSGVIADAVLWMVNAEVFHLLSIQPTPPAASQ